MKAAIVRRYGPPSNIQIGDVHEPDVKPNQVLVRVRAASINPLDTKLRAGSLRWVMPLTFPAVLGFDFAGEIERLGTTVAGWSTGDHVYGRTDARNGGTHAELTAVGSDVIDRMPSSLSFDQAASLPLVAMTAIQALQQVKLAPGERLLVNGAAGGVGSAAVQVGHAMGATVTGVCSSQSAPLVKRLGARILDYTKGELARTTEHFDVVLDTVFSAPTSDLMRVLADRGRYVTTGFSAGVLLRSTVDRVWSRRRFAFVMSRADGGLMRRVSEMVTAAELILVIDSIFPLTRIAEAHERVERGHTHGKIVVTIA